MVSKHLGPPTKRTRAVLGTVFFFRVGLGRDSIFTGLHGTFWAGFSTHGTPQDGTHHSRYSTAYFARDTVSTGHHGTGFNDRGIPRDVLGGIQQPRDTKERESFITGLHAGSSNHGT